MAIEENITKAPAAFWDVAKKYWIFALILLFLLMILLMGGKERILGWFTKENSTTKGDRLPLFLRKWLGATGAVLVGLGLGGILFGASDALAAVGGATCCAERAPALLAWLGDYWPAVAAALGSLMLGMTNLGAPDTIDLYETHGGSSLSVGTLSATTPQSMYMKTATHSVVAKGPKKGMPLVATDLTIKISCNVNQLTTGTATIDDQDLARLLAYLEITSPTMGALTDQVSCTGPVLDLVTRFIDDSFERSGDAPTISIVVPTGAGSATAVTKYFTRPFALRFLARPLSTAPWLGLLHDTNVSMGLAADTALGAVSTGATVDTRILRASLSYVPVPIWYYPMVAYDRVDNPASGSNGITFKNFGSAGPKCTEKTDWVHTLGHLSNLKGLGGNLTFDTVTKILGPVLGLDDISNVDQLVKARIRAQYYGRIGGVDYSGSGNWVTGTTNAVSMALNKLLFLFFIQPSLDMEIKNMLPMTATSELPLQYTTSTTRTGEDHFYIGAVRAVSASVIKDWQALPSSRLPSTIAGQTAYTTT